MLELFLLKFKKLYIPVIDDYKHDPDTLNQLVKDGKVEEVIRNQGEAIFTKLGFSKQDNEELMKIWQKLRDRRMRK